MPSDSDDSSEQTLKGAGDATKVSDSNRAEALRAEAATSGQRIDAPSAPGELELSKFEDRYLLRRELARGGMGRVIAARDRRIGREVAIKEMLSTKRPTSVIRFERESLMTARLQHPSIIPVYEIGRRNSGEPYIAMPLVHGKPLSELIKSEETPAQRLRLLPSVLSAVDAIAYAHQREVIHRDLKPANILVGELGETVVIDWGLAKDLGGAISDTPPSDGSSGEENGSGDLTLHGAIIGTPTFMAPEAARGEPADMRSDVYSLGAVLYQLLSGAQPFRGPTPQEVLKKVIGEEPISLEKCAPGVPTDLLSIVRKAMSREPAQRFPDAAALAAELRIFQSGQLVGSHRYSTRELLFRWAKKNRLVLGVALIALIALAIGAVISVRRIVAERDRANREAEVSTRVSGFLAGMFNLADPSQSHGNEISAREVLDRASKDIDQLSNEPEVQSKLMKVMSGVYSDLGLFARAEELARKALAVDRKRFGGGAPQTFSAMNALAIALYQEAKYSEAEPLMRELLDRRREIDGPDAHDTLGAEANLANLYDDTGRYEEARVLLEDSFERFKHTRGPEAPETLMSANNLVAVYISEERFTEALQLERETVATEERVLGSDHPNVLLSEEGLVTVLEERSLFTEAEALQVKLLATQKRVLGPEHPDTLVGIRILAVIYLDEHRVAEAEKLLREVLPLSIRIAGKEHPDTLSVLTVLGEVLADEGQLPEAEKIDRDLIEVRTRQRGADHTVTLNSKSDLVDVLRREKRYDEAETLGEQVLEARGRGTEGAVHVFYDYRRLAQVAADRGDKPLALARLKDALAHGEDPAELRKLGTSPDFKSLAAEPAFIALAADASVKADKLEQAAAQKK